MNRIFMRSAMAALVALSTFGLSSPASAQTTFEACRVPNVGAIYMINVAGAPNACLDPSHVMFSWTEGGAVADGEVTTAKLADDAVTSAKILDGTITQADLDASVSFPIGAGDVGTTELADDAVTSAKIADGAVAGVDIAAGAIGTGQLATGAVDSNAIADGAVGGADINSSEVQARLTQACATGGAIRAIASDGSVTCDPTDGNVAGTQDLGFSNPVTISSTALVELASLNVPGSQSGLLTVSAHAYAEMVPTAVGRFEFDLRIGSCSGTAIGTTWWRPELGAGIIAIPVAVTGYATGITGPTTISFCAAKFDGGANDMTAWMKGIVAQW